MGKQVKDLKTKTHVAEVVHHGDQLIVPNGMDLDGAIDLLQRRKKYMDTAVRVVEDFNVFPWDGAYALSQVLSQKYGWAEGKPIQSFFGEQKPVIIKVATAPGVKADVPWGHFSLPKVDGVLMCGYEKRNNGSIVFQLTAQVKRRDEHIVRDIFVALREYLKTGSIYQGKAIKLRFKDNDGDRLELPEPEFIDVSKTNPNGVIFSDDLHAQINASLFTPIERVHDCMANGIKVKRGVLLAGPYGTGKTLAAAVAAHLAVKNGITFVYTPHADELGDAIDFALQYQSPASVVFCEDIDRTVQGERTVEIDDILNILDGVDTKNGNIITVLTSNHLENINQAMVRPGRIDDTINVAPPDSRAVMRLIRHYGGATIAEDEDLSSVATVLDGQIPAVIEEVVKRAKLFQLALIPKGEKITNITAEALRQSALTMKTQIDLLAEKKPEELPRMDAALRHMLEQIIGNGSVRRQVLKGMQEYYG